VLLLHRLGSSWPSGGRGRRCGRLRQRRILLVLPVLLLRQRGRGGHTAAGVAGAAAMWVIPCEKRKLAGNASIDTTLGDPEVTARQNRAAHPGGSLTSKSSSSQLILWRCRGLCKGQQFVDGGGCRA